MLASPQIKTVKLADKKPGISDRSSFLRGVALNFNWFGRNGVATLTSPDCFKSMLSNVIHPQKCQNSFLRLRKMCPKDDAPYGIMKVYAF